MIVGGFNHAMMLAKRNKARVKRRREKKDSNIQYDNSDKKLEFKNVSEQKLKEVKSNIRNRSRSEQRINIFIAILIVAAVSFAVVWWFYNFNYQ